MLLLPGVGGQTAFGVAELVENQLAQLPAREFGVSVIAVVEQSGQAHFSNSIKSGGEFEASGSEFAGRSGRDSVFARLCKFLK